MTGAELPPEEDWEDRLEETALLPEPEPLRDERMLEGSRMTDRADAHEHIARVLAFPPGEGRDLDGLAQLLLELGPTSLILADPQDLLPDDPDYREALLDVLVRAALDSPLFDFRVEERSF